MAPGREDRRGDDGTDAGGHGKGVVLEYDMRREGASEERRPPHSRVASKRDKPWRKSASAVAAEREAARRALEDGRDAHSEPSATATTAAAGGCAGVEATSRSAGVDIDGLVHALEDGRDAHCEPSATATTAAAGGCAGLEATSRSAGVDIDGLVHALEAQDLLDLSAAASRASPPPSPSRPAHGEATTATPAPALSQAQSAVTKLLQVATNARPAEEVAAARQQVAQALADAGLPRPASAAEHRVGAPESAVGARARAAPSGGRGRGTRAAGRLEVMHRVIPRLWVGGWAALLNDCEALRRRGISAVVSVVSAPDRRRLPSFVLDHYHANVDDREDAADALAAHFAPICRFVHTARREGHSVFVHCGAGISRAPSTCAAYIVWALRISAADAVRLVRTARPCARPNPGFARALRAWEKRVRDGVCGVGMQPWSDDAKARGTPTPTGEGNDTQARTAHTDATAPSTGAGRKAEAEADGSAPPTTTAGPAPEDESAGAQHVSTGNPVAGPGV